MTAAVRPIDAILTKTQQRVLALLFVGEAERTLNELVRRSGGGSGAIRREVERMAAAGLLRERRVGNQRRFSADRASPFYPELAALAAKSTGPAPGRSATRARPSAALIAGRDFVTPDDVVAVAPAVLRHRLQLRPEAELERYTADDAVATAIAAVPVPR